MLIPRALLLAPLLCSPALAISVADIPSDLPVSKLLSLAQASFIARSFGDALAYYDVAISRDPSNYLSLFKRGATYLSLGRSSLARADFDKVLTIRPGFEGALQQRGELKAAEGDWQGAREDFTAAGKKQDEQKLSELAEAEGAAKLARDAERGRKWEECVTQAGVALMVAPRALHLRQTRAHCRLEKGGEEVEALGDLQAVLKINPAETRPALIVSAMFFYGLGETDKGIDAVRKCLHTDPDSKSCSKMWRRQRSLDKQLTRLKQLVEKRRFTEVVKQLVSSGTGEDLEPGLIDEVKEDQKTHRADKLIHYKTPEGFLTQLLDMACNAYLEMNNHKRAQPYCSDLLAHNPSAVPGLIHKAQAQLDADDFEAAIRTLNQAKDAPGGAANRRIADMLQNAQVLLKRSRTKDYYKVLGVERDATPKEIKKAWRKLSAVNHPDKVTNPEARDSAQKKMAAINEAYEVLSDEELRQRFDSGDDPNDPHSQQRGPNPFQGGGFPMGGGFPFQGFPGGGGGGGQPFMFQQGGGGQRRSGGQQFQFHFG